MLFNENFYELIGENKIFIFLFYEVIKIIFWNKQRI